MSLPSAVCTGGLYDDIEGDPLQAEVRGFRECKADTTRAVRQKVSIKPSSVLFMTVALPSEDYFFFFVWRLLPIE